MLRRSAAGASDIAEYAHAFSAYVEANRLYTVAGAMKVVGDNIEAAFAFAMRVVSFERFLAQALAGKVWFNINSKRGVVDLLWSMDPTKEVRKSPL